MAQTRGQSRVIALGLFVVLAFVYWACVRRYLPYDGDMMFRVTKSLVTAHSLRIEDPVLHLNEPYSFYGLAVSVLLVPLFMLGQLLAGDGRVLITSFEPIVTALTVIALLSLLVDLGVSWRRAFLVALLYAFGSLAWAYSGVLYSEPLVGLCTLVGVLFLRWYERKRQWRWLIAAGAAAALALLARWDSAVLVVLPLLGYVAYLLWKAPTLTLPNASNARIALKRGSRGPAGPRKRGREILLFVSPIALVTVINLAYDLFRYGRPLASPYLGTFRFSTPLPVGLFGLLFSPGAGLVVYVPVVLIGGFGGRALYRRWPAVTILIAGLVVVRLLLYGQWYGWDGGITFGPRFLVPIVPLLFVPVAFAVRGRVITALTVVLGALSIGVELVNQAVPYGQYYTSVAATLDAAARQACPGCPLWQVVQLTTARLDYDWQYIPLRGQLAMLFAGRVDPIWSHIALAVPLLAAVVGFVLFRLYRLTTRLDRATVAQPSTTAQSLAQAS